MLAYHKQQYQAFLRTTMFTFFSFRFHYPNNTLNLVLVSRYHKSLVRETSPSTLSCHSSMASSSPQPAFTLPVQPFAQQLMHKNRLQEFAQKSNIALPVYQTINEGQQHAPSFRSTVWVDGMSYASQSTFSNQKTAEQEAARLALKFLSKRTRDEAPSLVCKISTFCKSILNEYAAKLNLEGPTYDTVQQEGLLPVFISSIVFNGTIYTGDAARNRKDAEQLAARAAILSILGNSDSGTMLFEMINSKSKLNVAIKGNGLQDIHASAVTPTMNTGQTYVKLGHKDTEFAGSVADNNDESKVEFQESSRMASTCQEFKIPKQEPSPEATKVSNVSLQQCSVHPIDGGSSLKRQRKN
ncbi:Double-stranded RNA-binding protein 4 [Spatholobus suberectus]|nr:Double-stranded RNA-binding protein 4 [Spatholobus suberectus]